MSTIRLPSGEAASLLHLDTDKATLVSPLPSPPGSTVTCVVSVDEATLGEFQLKVSRCRKVDEAFHIDGRIRNATREVRAVLRVTPESS